MGIVQAAAVLQLAASLARRHQRISLQRIIPRLSSSNRPFWKYQQHQQCLSSTTTTTTRQQQAQQQQQQQQPCRSSYYGSHHHHHHHHANSSFLAIIPLTSYNDRISIIPPSPHHHHSPIRIMATTTARRISSLSTTETFRESKGGIIMGSSSHNDDNDDDNNINNNNDDNVVTTTTIWESVNDLETKVMRQMAHRLLTNNNNNNGGDAYYYNAHTWLDAEDALKWWSSQRTVESVHICFALLDRFVQETTASTTASLSSHQQILDDDNDNQQHGDDSIHVSNNNKSSTSSLNGLASFLDWRLMGAIMGNWTAVWKECIDEKNSSSSKKDKDLLQKHLLTPRIALERLDRYALEHPQVSGFVCPRTILSNVLNTAITQSRAMLRLGSTTSSSHQRRGDDGDNDHYSPLLPPWYAENQSSSRSQQKQQQEATRTATTFQQEQQFSFLTMVDTKNHHSNKSSSSNSAIIASPPVRTNSTLMNDDESDDDEHDIVEMVQFCTRVLDRLLGEYNHHHHHNNNINDMRDTHHHQQRSSSSSSRRASVYFCNSILHLWSHVCSRSTTIEDLERAVQQAEHVFSLSLNARVPLDIISYNTMLDVYAQAGKGHQAESLLQTMFQNWQFHQEHQQASSSVNHQDDEHAYDVVVEPDVISFNTTAAAWARSAPSNEAPERLHSLWHAMLDPGHYGQLPACRQGTIISNVFYNTMLLAWAKSGRSDAGEGAEEFLREMILRTSLSSSSSRLHRDNSSVYGDNKEEIVMARQQYEQQQPDIISYGTVAYAYSQVGRAEDAERIARELYQAFLETPPDNTQRREALRPTTVLLTHVIDAWARSTTHGHEDRVVRIRAIIDDMYRLYEEGVIKDPPDTWTWNILLRCIVDMATTAAGTEKSSKKSTGERDKPQKLMQEALGLLEVMTNQGAQPNSWSYSMIILGFLEQHQLRQALELLHQACVIEQVNLDVRTVARVILAAVSKKEGGIKEMKQATSLLHRLFDACEPDALVAKSDESNEKRRTLSSGGKPTARLTGAVVAGWSRLCNRNSNRSHVAADNALLACQEATALMERMRAMYQAGNLTEGPDVGIMRLVVSCWARFSRSDNPQHIKKEAAMKALQYLQEMRQMAKTDPDNRTMLPDLVTYDEVLECLATAREPQRAETLLKQMTDDYNQRGADTNAAKPNAECFNSVLLGWALVSSPSNAEVVTNRAQGVLDAMQRLPLSANRETYHHMIHVWANAGRPDIAENIFYRMKDEYQREVTMVKNNKSNTKDPLQQEQQPNRSTLQPTTHSYRRIIQAWTAMPSNTTSSFNPERAERLLLEMYQWFKSGENDKVCPFPECFHMVAQAWHELAMTHPDGGQQLRQFRKRAEYVLSLNRDLPQSPPSSTT